MAIGSVSLAVRTPLWLWTDRCRGPWEPQHLPWLLPALSQVGAPWVCGGEAQSRARRCVTGVCSGAPTPGASGPGWWVVWRQGHNPEPAPCQAHWDPQPRVRDGVQAPSSRGGSECGLSPSGRGREPRFLLELGAWSSGAQDQGWDSRTVSGKWPPPRPFAYPVLTGFHSSDSVLLRRRRVGETAVSCSLAS